MVSLVAQELVTLPDHPSSLPVFSRVPVAQSLVFCVMFYISLFVLLILAIVFLITHVTSHFFSSNRCVLTYDNHLVIKMYFIYKKIYQIKQIETKVEMNEQEQKLYILEMKLKKQIQSKKHVN